MIAALSAGKAILIGVASGVVVVIAAGAMLAQVRRPRRAAAVDIPPGMRPGPSDPDLEKPLLEKLIIWGAVLVLVMAIWVPIVWLREPDTNRDDTKAQLAASIERGRLTTMPGSEENQLGFNCERCHGPGLKGGVNVFNGTVVNPPNLTTVCGGGEFGHPQIHSLNDIVNTIAQGRPNTDMPSWSVRFAGAMTDVQIEDLVNYIISIQKVPEAKNLCTNPEAAAGPSPSPTVGVSGAGSSPTAGSSSGSPSPSPSSSP